ncbi:DUF5677 domain-containing protein [Marinilactibacillus sp. GCM10026970]|uniref:DUF5677 domain-containing protein n=1 Tax=Marinilactibacillus sp. GCM10026970 TaxID=3252642 RepID=UPI00361C8C2D
MLISIREVYKYEKILKSCSNKIDDDFTRTFIESQIQILLEKLRVYIESIKKKRVNSSRTLIRPILESVADTLYILEEEDKINLKCYTYNVWHTQKFMYNITKINKDGQIIEPKELEKAINELMLDFKLGDNFDMLNEFITMERNYLFKGKNRRNWFNLENKYENTDTFLISQVTPLGLYLYNFYSEYVHGKDIFFRLGKVKYEINYQDIIAQMVILNSLGDIFYRLVKVTDTYEECANDINALIAYNKSLEKKKENVLRKINYQDN